MDNHTYIPCSYLDHFYDIVFLQSHIYIFDAETLVLHIYFQISFLQICSHIVKTMG